VAFSAAAWDAISRAAPTSLRDRSGPDLALREAEQARYADAEVAPAVALDAAFSASPVAAAARPAGDTSTARPGMQATAIPVAWTTQRRSERSRLVWSMAAILAIGIGLGFAVGYLFKTPAAPSQASNREAQLQPVASSTPAAKEAPAPTATAGHDFTESVVPATPKPATPAAADNNSAVPPAPAPPPQFEGRLLVRSEPAGASVIVDGREHGTTPTVVRGLGRGTHRVRVIRDGYLPDERNVAVTRNQPSPSLLVTLEPRHPAAERISQSASSDPGRTITPYTGSLVVESLPPGASVYLDNKPVGRTPLTLNSVNAGEHVVRLERDGYRRWGRSIRVVAAERNRVTASLER
jgi:PEGA domain-containing protein